VTVSFAQWLLESLIVPAMDSRFRGNDKVRIVNRSRSIKLFARFTPPRNKPPPHSPHRDRAQTPHNNSAHIVAEASAHRGNSGDTKLFSPRQPKREWPPRSDNGASFVGMTAVGGRPQMSPLFLVRTKTRRGRVSIAVALCHTRHFGFNVGNVAAMPCSGRNVFASSCLRANQIHGVAKSGGKPVLRRAAGITVSELQCRFIKCTIPLSLSGRGARLSAAA
jgi:hypothetical protein